MFASFAISSTNGVRYYLKMLEDAGYIHRSRKISRGIGPAASARPTGIPLLGRVPFDVRLREGGDSGHPLVLSDPDAPASTVLREVATRLGTRARGLAGMSLGITPAGRL